MSAVANAWGTSSCRMAPVPVSSDGSYATVKVQWSVPIFVHFPNFTYEMLGYYTLPRDHSFHLIARRLGLLQVPTNEANLTSLGNRVLH